MAGWVHMRTFMAGAISTGVFGYPKHDAAHTAIGTINRWINQHPDRFDRVICCAYTPADRAAYDTALKESTR